MMMPTLTEMYAEAYQDISTNRLDSSNRYHRVFSLGNRTMIAALAVVLATVVVCYTHYEYFSIGVQVAGHIAMILGVTAIKIGYVMRCVGLNGLGVKQL